jgi:membrane protease YdiL (CAAX protease family)
LISIPMAVPLRTLLQRHALLAFCGLTFALSWSLWGLQSLLASTDPIPARWLGTIAAYGPTLAAIALAGLLRPERQAAAWSRRRLWLAGGVLAGTVGLNLTIASNPLDSPQPLLALLFWLVITLLPAWIVWQIFSRRTGVRALLRTLVTWRVAPLWYLAALLLPVIISGMGSPLMALLGQPLPPMPRTESLRELLPLLATTFVATLLYGGPLGEEVGWRGFALPRLQVRYSPLVASLLLSVVWGLWHVPLHLQGVYHGIFPDGLPGILLRIVTTVPTTILFTWLYNRTQGNLWLVVLLHTAVNNSAGFWLPITAGVYVTMSIATVTLIITDRMWRLLPLASAPVLAEGQVEPLDHKQRDVAKMIR